MKFGARSAATCALALALAASACGKTSGEATGAAGSGGTTGAAGTSADAAAGSTGVGGDADAGPPPDVGPVTYYKDVQPLLARRCTTCHVEGGIAPFTLATYDDAMRNASAIAGITALGEMPPWMPAPGCGDFRDARVLTPLELATLAAWSAQGAPAGDPATAPPPPSKASDLGAPSVTLDPGADYQPNSALSDDYHCTLIDPKLAAAQDLVGFDIHPGSGATVHHVILFSVPPDKVAAAQAVDAAEAGLGWTCFGGSGVDGTATIAGWVPGSGATAFPPPTGIHLDAGTQIIMQIHYNLANDNHATDRTKADLFYSKTPIEAWGRAAITAVANTTFYVAANAKQTVSADLPIKNGNFDLWGVVPHMHLHGTELKVQIKHANGTSECAVDIPQWNFHWQQFYYYQQATKVVPGDTIHLECTFDNTAAAQPYINGKQITPAPLHWGEKTTDEMCLNYLYFTLTKPGSL